MRAKLAQLPLFAGRLTQPPRSAGSQESTVDSNHAHRGLHSAAGHRGIGHCITSQDKQRKGFTHVAFVINKISDITQVISI
jgi:hypothetical protein